MLGVLAAAVAAAALVLALAVPAADLRLERSDVWRDAARVIRSIVQRRRRARASRYVLETLQATHAALRSGRPLSAALRSAVEAAPAVSQEIFAPALRAFDLNIALDEALRSAAAEADRRSSLGLEALALIGAEQLPAARAAPVLASVCDRLAFEERLVGEIAARTGGLRAQIVLLAFLVPAIAAYLVMTVPGVGSTLSSDLGLHVLVPAALLFELAGILASRTIVRSVRA